MSSQPDSGLDPWRGRLISLILGLLIVTVPLAWAMSSYYDVSLGSVLSFPGDDGAQGFLCRPESQGLGVHCFGDYQRPRMLALDYFGGEPPASGLSYSGLYPPVSMAPHVLSFVAGETALGARGALAVYLIILAAALLLPAFVSSRVGRGLTDRLLPLLVIGVAAVPFLATMDRGNSAGFAVPFLLAFAWYLARDPEWAAPLAAIGAASVRPQYILVAVAFLALGRLKHAVLSVAGFAAVSIVYWTLWPGDTVANIRSWLASAGSYLGYATDDLTGQAPANLSVARVGTSVGHLLEQIGGPFQGIGRSLVALVQNHPALPGLSLVVLCAAVFLFARGHTPRPIAVVVGLALPALVPAVSLSYYLVFVLVIGGLILGPAVVRMPGCGRRFLPQGGFFTERDRMFPGGTRWAWLVVIVTALSLVPLPLTLASGRNSLLLEAAGGLWLLVCVSGLACAWATYLKRARQDGVYTSV